VVETMMSADSGIAPASGALAAHDAPEWCSRWAGIGAHDRPEWVLTMRRNTHLVIERFVSDKYSRQPWKIKMLLEDGPKIL
jgi:hypothetical protein